MMYDVIIVGAGAAGVFLGALLREQSPHLRVCLLEAGHQPLVKVRISGGGRCNVTHNCDDPTVLAQQYPRGGAWLKPLLYQFGPKHMQAWLAQQGLQLKAEPDGRMFPLTDSSDTIVQALLRSLHPTPIHTAHRLTDLSALPTGGWQLIVQHAGVNSPWAARNVILATGGSPPVWRLLEKLGQAITPPVPSLFTFTLDAPWLTALAGVSTPDASVSLPGHKRIAPQRGPVLITHWGISGPATLRLSAFAAKALADVGYKTIVQIDWLPSLSWDDCRQSLLAYKAAHPTRQPVTHPVLALPKQLWKTLVEPVTPDQWAQLSNAQLHQVITQLKQCALPMTGKGVFKDEFVQAGGVSLKGVNAKTLESKTLPGLYFAGEILDVDGVTGGFNFQNAWATAYAVAQALQ